MKIISITLEEIINDFKTKLNDSLKTKCKFLIKRNLFEFEKILFSEVTELYNNIAESIIEYALTCEDMKENLRQYGQKKGLGKLKLRETNLQLFTGKTIRYSGYYATNQTVQGYDGTRHIEQAYWGCEKKASPMYYSLISILSVVCPSFDVANEIMGQLNIEGNYNRIRDLSEHIGRKCLKDRINIGLKANETLKGKRVIITVDGGRSRIREYTEQYNKGSNYSKYETPWHEPKLFVIHIIDEEGKIEKAELPIYDCVLDNCDVCFNLLEQYLKRLNIKEAKEVQFISDGAQWIWARVKPMLLKLKVKKEVITETVDYYHAVEHLSALIDTLPKSIKSQKGEKLFKQLKDFLWKGEITQILSVIKSTCKKIGGNMLRELTYFLKNEKRMMYEKYRDLKLLCGSGIVESAIRRVINLRFKCPSSFWNEDNLEGLIYLRAILLSKRWSIMINNLNNQGYKY